MAGLYLQVEVLELDDERLIDAGMDGRGAYLTVGLLAKRTETDGWVSLAQLRKEGADATMIEPLIAAGLLDASVDRRVRQSGWLDRNPSQAAIDLRREAKAEAGKRGNHDRWKHPEPFDSCSKCHVVAGCDTGAIQGANRVGSPDTKSDTESKSKSDSSSASVSEIQSPPPAVIAETPPKLTGQALEQATNRSLLRWSNTVAAASADHSPSGFARTLRADAAHDGNRATLEAWIADGMDPDDAADRLAADGGTGNAGTEAERAAAHAAAKAREQATTDALAAIAERPTTDHAAHIASIRGAGPDPMAVGA